VKWIHAADGVYLQLQRYQSSGADNSDGFYEYINLASGKLTRYGFDEPGQPTSVIPPKVLPKQDNGANVSYQLTAQTEWTTEDSTQNTIYQTKTWGDIILSDAITGRTLSLYPDRFLISDRDYVGSTWFDEGRFLGVWFHYYQSEQSPSDDPYYFDPGDHVDVFDTNGNLVQTFDGVSQVRWSNQHEKMLYRDYYDYSNVCVVDTQNISDQECDPLKEWQSTHHSEIQDYQWSLDGKKIIFTYTRDDQKAGGLCIADATSFDVECPITKEITDGNFYGVYSYWPDNVYGFFNYNKSVSEDNSGVTPESGLCLLNQQTYAVDCVSDRVLPENTFVSRESLSPSHHLLAMLYTGLTLEYRDGICPIDLQTGAVVCSNVTDINDGLIDTYGWSPDSRFFIANYGYGPGSDDKTYSRFGIYDTVTGVYRDEGYAMFENSYDALWRPSLKP
jgi:hypothetical protein